MLKDKWDEMSSKNKRIVTIVGAAVFMLLIIWFFSGDTPERERRGNEDTVRHILTDRDTRDVSIDGLAAQLRISNQQQDELRNELNTLQRSLDQKSQRADSSEEMRRELDALHGQLEMLIEQNMDLARIADERAPVSPNRAIPGSGNRPLEDGESPFEVLGITPDAQQQREQRDPYEIDPEDVFSRPIQTAQTQWEEDVAGAPGQASAARNRNNVDEEDSQYEAPIAASGASGATIFQHTAQESEAERAAREAGEHGDDALYVPAGSILTGVMLNGMDAPTNSGARRDPFPSLLRLNHEAILPNRYTADIRECHMLVAGHGDLSSERAYLRAETISCIRNDGGVIEARMDAYAVGEDGKTGVRGRLVSKQGAMIARSLVAGFMSGASSAFDVSPIPVIQTGANQSGNTQYQSNFSPSMFQGAAAQGASQALDRVAQFYVDMAENIFPVIEVDAGREIELIMTRGASLKIRN
tara:strand:- start:3268 stop:4680 length:1413 start_codon:yes stop_codon:yes gene_type:complete